MFGESKRNVVCDLITPVLQTQDSNGVSSESGFELSELMKRRLESVASTGSSASSGFIEDKSYCDSEEEEEGNKPSQARLASSTLAAHLSPLTPRPIASDCPPHSLLPLAPPLLHRNEPPLILIRLFSSLRLIGRFHLLFRGTITTAGATVTPTESGEAAVYFLSRARPPLRSAAPARRSHPLLSLF